MVSLASCLPGFLVTCCSRAPPGSSGRWCGSEGSPWDSVSPWAAAGWELALSGSCRAWVV